MDVRHTQRCGLCAGHGIKEYKCLLYTCAAKVEERDDPEVRASRLNITNVFLQLSNHVTCSHFDFSHCYNLCATCVTVRLCCM